MSDDTYFRPTLLVGVGGTGCRVAEEIFVKARAENPDRNDRIGALAFDTNEVDLAKLQAVPSSGHIQFSTTDPVYKIVGNNPEVEGDWFLPLNQVPHEVKNLSLVKGAAQYRVLTRLALHEAFRSGDMVRRAERAISNVAAVDGRNQFGSWINILIVGSLAGATGSGMFYQVALILQDLCKRNGIKSNVMGLFMMPDIFVKSGVMPTRNHRYVRANAYAALREVNALNVLSTIEHRGANFKYEFAPRRPLKGGETPFNLVTMIDYETAAGNTMGQSHDNYTELMARAGHMLIFTPLGGEFEGMEVNLLGERMRAALEGDSALYSSIGVSALNFPKERMRDYLVNRLVLDSIDENWVRLDQLYQQREREHVERKERGKATGEEPKIEETYLRDLELLATEDKAPFFVDIWKGLKPEREDEETRRVTQRNLFDIYLDAVTEDAKGRFWRAGGLQRVSKESGLNPSIFEEESRISDAVEDQQYALESDWRDISEALRSEPETIFNSNWTYADSARERDWRDHHIQSFLIKNGPHPVRSRALLYQLRREIARCRAALDPEALRKRLFGLAKTFDNTHDDTAGNIGNSAIFEQADKASKQGTLSRLMGDSARAFIEQYSNYYNGVRRNMRAYAEEALLDTILELLAREVDDLIYAYSGLFSKIGGISERLSGQIAREETRFEGRAAGADGNVWTYASRECLRSAWNRVQTQSQGINMGDEINRELAASVFDLYRKAKSRDDISFNALGKLFQDKVIDDFGAETIRDNFGSVWNISAIEATRREAEVTKQDWQDLLRVRLSLVQSQAEPFSLINDREAGTGIKYWAMNSATREEIGDNKLFADVFADSDGDNTLARNSFDPSVVYCINFRLSLTLENFDKLNSGDETDRNVNAEREGTYQLAYREMIDELVEAERTHPDRPGRFSPHVHKDWHKPGVLPEISVKLEKRVQRRSARAGVIAQMLRLISEEKDSGNRRTMEFDTKNSSVPFSPPTNKLLVKDGDTLQALDMIMQSADLMEVAEEFWANARYHHGPDGAASESGARLLDAEALSGIAEVALDRRDTRRGEALAESLFRQWCELTGEFFYEAHKDMVDDARLDEIERITGQMRIDLGDKLAARGVRDETVKAIIRRFDAAGDAFRDSYMTAFLDRMEAERRTNG